MTRALLLAPLVACTIVVSAQNRGPLELATAAVPAGAQRIAYGSDPQQFGELRVPATRGPHPLAIVIHGGCWVETLASMDARAVAIDNMRPLAAALTAAGIATWNIEYRRLGNAGGGWPGTFLDVARAADHVRALASISSICRASSRSATRPEVTSRCGSPRDPSSRTRANSTSRIRCG